MANISLVLPLQNEGSKVMRLVLEPLCESFLVDPGQKVEIHAIFDERTNNKSFTVAPNDDCLIVYAPGEIPGFVDHYVVSQGRRLLPQHETDEGPQA